MKVVIDIPEKTYHRIQALVSNDYFEHDICGDSMRRIASGTPLPKGCGDLVDRNAFDIDNLDRAYDDNFELDFGRLYTKDVENMIANIPAIIEADKESEVEE